MNWVEVQTCPDCGDILATFSVSRGWCYRSGVGPKFCPRCGAHHNLTKTPTADRVRVACWVSTGSWLNPLTWGSGHYMLREDYLAQQEVQTELAKVKGTP